MLPFSGVKILVQRILDITVAGNASVSIQLNHVMYGNSRK